MGWPRPSGVSAIVRPIPTSRPLGVELDCAAERDGRSGCPAAAEARNAAAESLPHQLHLPKDVGFLAVGRVRRAGEGAAIVAGELGVGQILVIGGAGVDGVELQGHFARRLLPQHGFVERGGERETRGGELVAGLLSVAVNDQNTEGADDADRKWARKGGFSQARRAAAAIILREPGQVAEGPTPRHFFPDVSCGLLPRSWSCGPLAQLQVRLNFQSTDCLVRLAR